MSDAAPEKLKPSKLAQAVRISVPYASQIIRGDRTPPIPMAIKIFRETGHRFGRISDASEAEIAILERFQGEPADPKGEA